MTSRPPRLSIVMFSILSLNICLSVLSISLLLFIVMLSMIICCLNVCVVKDDMMWVVMTTGDGVGDGDGGNKPLRCCCREMSALARLLVWSLAPEIESEVSFV